MHGQNNNLKPDEFLVQSIKENDTAAFKILYYKYYNQLFRYAYYRLYSTETASDLLQDLFTRVWKNRKLLNPNKSIKAYLYKSLTNLIINHSKLKSSQNISYNTMKEDTTEHRLDIDTEIDIQNALNKLPEKLKTVFVLSRVEGFKYNEIAEVCSISIKAVEKRMSRAFYLLRDLLK